MTAPNPRPVPYLSVTPLSATERGVTIRYVGYDGAFVLHYGDGTSLVASGNRNYKHVFEQPGVYQVVARASGTQQLLTQTTAVVRAGTTPQGIEWGPAPDNPEIWQARFGEVEPTEVPPLYRIDWGDGTPATEVWGLPGTVLEHPLPVGEHTVRVHDVQTRRWGDTTQTVTGPTYDPDFTITEVPVSGSGRRAKVRLTLTTVQAGKPISIDWGELFTEPQTDEAPAPGKAYEFVYPTDGPKFPAVTYQDGSGTPNDQGFVQVPFTDDEEQQ